MKSLPFLFFLFSPSMVMGLDLLVKEDKVPVYANSSLSNSPLIQRLKKGDHVNGQDRIGNFWEVELPQKQLGYVEYSKLKILKKHPKKQGFQEIKTEERQDIDPLIYRTRSHIAASIEYDEDSDLNALMKTAPDLRMIYSMEAFVAQPSLEEITKERQKKEIELGRNMAGRLVQFYGNYEDEALFRYLNKLGTYLSLYSDREDSLYKFAVLNTDVVNVFSCPGDYILVTLGALESMENEAELAMFLSHAIAHAEKKHLINSLQKFNAVSLKHMNKKHLDHLLQIRARIQPTETDQSGGDIAQYITGTLEPKLAFLHTVKAGLYFLIEKGLDKEKEYEADELGIQIAVRANYDPFAWGTYLERLDKNKETMNVEMFQKTHPQFSNRKQNLKSFLEKIHAAEMTGNRKEEARFLRYKHKLRKKEIE